MSGDVTVALASEGITVLVTYEVSDAPPLHSTPTVRFDPDELQVEYVDSRLSWVRIRGQRVTKKPDAVRDIRHRRWYVGGADKSRWGRLLEDLPDWARPYLAPPRKPRPTVLLTNDDLVRILAGSEMGCGGHANEESGLPRQPPFAREPAEFTVRLYTPQELLEAARRARKAAADATGNPDAGQGMTLEQAAALTRRYDLEKMLEGRG